MRVRNLVLIFLFSFSLHLFAQENISFQKPPKEILDLVEYERPPGVLMDSDKNYIILTYRSTYKTLDDLNQKELRLGGLRINPDHHISSTITYLNNLKVRKISDKNEIQVKGLPENPRIAYLTWSPDESKIAFTNTGKNGLELWILDIKSATAKKISTQPLNANLGNPITWFHDNQNILVTTVQDNLKLIDPEKELPEGPIVSNSDGSVSQNRTYQDLLKNKTDEHNFEQITTTQIYKVNLNGEVKLFKDKDMYRNISFSPDGKYVMISTIQKPFSYLVPLSRFPSEQTVYTSEGNLVKQVNQLDLAEIMPKGFMAVRQGKRSMYWRSDLPSTLVYVEALDEGDPAKEVEFRDAVYTWKAPFDSAPELLTKTAQRFAGIQWGNENYAILMDQWYDTRSRRTYLLNPSQPGSQPKLISDRNYQDIYSDPGSFETRKNEFGRYVLAIDGTTTYLIGEGYTPEGQFPFIDKLDLKTLKTTRWYQSTYKDKIENIFTITDFKKGTALVRIESATDYPNYYFRNLNRKESITQLTDFKNPFESIKDVHKEVIKYQRKDGVELSGTLYLPAGYDKKEKLPLLIWAYPSEYKDKNSAGQSSHNPNEFTFPYYGSFVYWVTRGYAVLDDAAFPIIGEGDTEPNDTFVEQLIWNAEAAIDAVDKLGYIDRKRVGVGGHSYGAFMTANLLTHSDLFACGIARSGAYNRTLTPFGFQREQRNYWEVPEVYNRMSPFMNAEKMKTPMLLTHGEADNNPGTFTLQTERYFQALKGLGAPVRMVILPKESHGYVAKENILHLLWEQDQFLETYLK
ncbi:MAG: S9 family peptidase [Flavobacteriaceae bacterium]|jgi:dipeptidyl aminopeptidase/acylaminoacyl peptidase|nr:S9 family peptidase [Flavobacteriaceae bacterium]